MSEYNIRGKDQFCFISFWISVCVHVYHIVKWHISYCSCGPKSVKSTVLGDLIQCHSFKYHLYANASEIQTYIFNGTSLLNSRFIYSVTYLISQLGCLSSVAN